MKIAFFKRSFIIFCQRLVLFGCLFFLSINFTQGQTATADRKEIFIGEQVKIELSINTIAGKSIVFPQVADTIISKVEVLEKSEITDEKDDKGNSISKKQVLYITSFDSGFYAIPPFKFLVNGNPVITESFLLTVKNVEIDTTKGIKDIKENFDEAFNLMDYIKVYWRYIAGGFAILAIIVYVIYYFNKKSKQPKPLFIKPEKVRPLDVVTVEALNNLRLKNLHKIPDELKVFHTELTDIVRDYIEKRFMVNAMEKTSDELMHGLRLTEVNKLSIEKLRRVLALADLVKFAKEKPLDNENEQSIDYAIAFVNENTPNEMNMTPETKQP